MKLSVVYKKQCVTPSLRWEEIDGYHKAMYELFNTDNGKYFLEEFAGSIYCESYDNKIPVENPAVYLEGRRSVIRELLILIEVLNGIKQRHDDTSRIS